MNIQKLRAKCYAIVKGDLNFGIWIYTLEFGFKVAKQTHTSGTKNLTKLY